MGITPGRIYKKLSESGNAQKLRPAEREARVERLQLFHAPLKPIKTRCGAPEGMYYVEKRRK